MAGVVSVCADHSKDEDDPERWVFSATIITDGHAAYDRDLNVDITSAYRLTGGIIGVQVQGRKNLLRLGH